MRDRLSIVLVILCILVICISAGYAQTQSQRTEVKQGKAMTNRASGTFEVKLNPQAEGAGAPVGRMTLDKQFQGDLAGTSKGQMLTGMTAVQGSAGYVAIEKVTGTLNGRRGSFYLQHSGTMTRGAAELSITVIPDSGTEQLAGLRGKMNIIIEGGKHSYEFDYALGDAP
jgi:Protein of unknown function (DUF3224)